MGANGERSDVPDDVDVLVFGAGPSGACLAANLARLRRVMLVQLDDASTAAPRPGETLVPAARRLFVDMGLWEDFAAEQHEKWHANLSIWGEAHLAERPLIADIDGHGWHLDRPRFDRWLRDVARQRGAFVAAPARLHDLRRDPAGVWRAQLNFGGQQRHVGARILVDATGRRAMLGRRLGARRETEDRMIARWARLDSDGDGAGTSFVQSHEAGWWYAARRCDHCLLSFHTDSDLPAARGLRGTDAFLEAAAESGVLAQLGLEHATTCAEGTRAAASGTLAPRVGVGWLAVGDAAATLDPLGSRGVFTALFSGLAAAETCERWFSGALAAFDDYAALMKQITMAHRRERDRAYAMETRWANALFWQRRHASSCSRPPPQTKTARRAFAAAG